MDDEQILAAGGSIEDIIKYANDNGANLSPNDVKTYKSVTELCADNPNLLEYIGQLEKERDTLAKTVYVLREALEWIASQRDLFFAECSQAEEIISRCKQALTTPSISNLTVVSLEKWNKLNDLIESAIMDFDKLKAVIGDAGPTTAQLYREELEKIK